MQGIYMFDIFGSMQVWLSVDDYMNGLECDLYLQREDDVEHFLSLFCNEDEVFDSSSYLSEVAV